MKKLLIMAAFVPCLLSAADAKPETLKKQDAKEFHVFTERASRDNHYAESGWMGDFGDLKFNKGWKDNPAAGETCIKITYSAERKQGAGWAGIYWQNPANNWGDKKGGFNLSAYKKLSFMVRGEKGGELIDKFIVGGITGQLEDGDSDESSIQAIELTKNWKKYEIDLKGGNFDHVIGGFGFALNADSNDKGAVFYLDNIIYEKEPVNQKLTLKGE